MFWLVSQLVGLVLVLLGIALACVVVYVAVMAAGLAVVAPSMAIWEGGKWIYKKWRSKRDCQWNLEGP